MQGFLSQKVNQVNQILCFVIKTLLSSFNYQIKTIPLGQISSFNLGLLFTPVVCCSATLIPPFFLQTWLSCMKGEFFTLDPVPIYDIGFGFRANPHFSCATNLLNSWITKSWKLFDELVNLDREAQITNSAKDIFLSLWFKFDE